MEQEIKVSVVLPVYNAELYIEAAITSVLNQSFSEFELIVIDDGSTDNSLEIIKSFTDKRIKLISRENKGLVSTLNEGVSLSQSNYIARMDADDICHPDRFKVQYDSFQKNKALVLHSSNVRYIDDNGLILGYSNSVISNKAVKIQLRKGNCIFHPSVMFCKKSFYKVGGYNERIPKFFEDYLLWLKLKDVGDFECSYRSLLDYRLLESSLSHNRSELVIKMYKKVVDSSGEYDGIYKDFEVALSDRSFINCHKSRTLKNFWIKFPIVMFKEILCMMK
ncbi:glycosyltransferase family 2 protein [Photobacterium minamisatsumaniensis]|uniref:glycosyltransferase family 2 protein n=1 Tax=Photobacterium minamisatsumaniensis TaxID=2910233 RepID=UPI003D13E333